MRIAETSQCDRLLRAVFFDVVCGRFVGMTHGMRMVRLCRVGVMRGFLVMAGIVMLGRVLMMFGRLFVVLGRLLVMLDSFLRHKRLTF